MILIDRVEGMAPTKESTTITLVKNMEFLDKMLPKKQYFE